MRLKNSIKGMIASQALSKNELKRQIGELIDSEQVLQALVRIDKALSRDPEFMSGSISLNLPDTLHIRCMDITGSQPDETKEKFKQAGYPDMRMINGESRHWLFINVAQDVEDSLFDEFPLEIKQNIPLLELYAALGFPVLTTSQLARGEP